MKRLLVLLLMFVSTTAVGAEINGHFDVGRDVTNDIWVTDFSLELNYHFLIDHRIFGGQTVLFQNNGMEGDPFRDIYILGYRLQHKWFYTEMEHYCNHVVLDADVPQYLYKDMFKKGTLIKIGIEW